MAKVTFKNRGVAAYVSLTINQNPLITNLGYEFESDKSESEWESDYARSDFSVFNSLLITFGEEQRRIKTLLHG